MPLVTGTPSKNSGKSPTVSSPPPLFSTTLVIVIVVGVNVLVMVHAAVPPARIIMSPLESHAPSNVAT